MASWRLGVFAREPFEKLENVSSSQENNPSIFYACTGMSSIGPSGPFLSLVYGKGQWSGVGGQEVKIKGWLDECLTAGMIRFAKGMIAWRQG